MDKTFIEERIQEKAESRFEDDLKNLLAFIDNNPIGQKFELEIKGFEKKIILRTSQGSSAVEEIFAMENNEQIKTNFKEVKKELIKGYVERETDNLLTKLDNLFYLFNQEG